MAGSTVGERTTSQAPSGRAGRVSVTRAAGLDLAIDKSLPTPAYLQLRDQLARAIAGGDLPAGAALPSERGLAVGLGLSRMTVRRAFEELVAAGVVEQRQGSGTFVKPRPVEQVIDRVLGFTDEARNLGFQPGALLIAADVVAADEQVAQALGHDEGTPVLRLTRLRTATGEPLALQDAYLRRDLAGLSLERLAETGSLYRTLESQFGIRPARARQTIAARLPTEHECRVLGIARSVPVLALERTTHGDDGRPFEFVRSAYRGDVYRMALDLRSF
ncbi:MAG TPA: GntR family transcriptional regulator [Trueperaceae bacterium]|nr:GntR family transcriptional regulator [Trueperaceae bacterium]